MAVVTFDTSTSAASASSSTTALVVALYAPTFNTVSVAVFTEAIIGRFTAIVY